MQIACSDRCRCSNCKNLPEHAERLYGRAAAAAAAVSATMLGVGLPRPAAPHRAPVAQAQVQAQQQQEALVRGLDALGAALTDDAVNGVCVAMLRNAVPGMSSRATASSSSSSSTSSSSLATAGAAAGYRRGIAEGDPPPVKRVRTESAGQDGSDGDHTHPADDSEGPDEEGSEDPDGGAKAIRTVLKAFSDALVAASRTQPSVSIVPPDDAVHPMPTASASSAAAAAADAADASSSSASLTTVFPSEAGDAVPVKVAPLIRIVSESPTAATSGADEALQASETGIENGKADDFPLVGRPGLGEGPWAAHAAAAAVTSP